MKPSAGAQESTAHSPHGARTGRSNGSYRVLRIPRMFSASAKRQTRPSLDAGTACCGYVSDPVGDWIAFAEAQTVNPNVANGQTPIRSGWVSDATAGVRRRKASQPRVAGPTVS